jgi:hypothetical protein
MSLLAIIVVVVVVLAIVFFIGGYIVVKRRNEAREPDLRRRIASADRALQAALAADRGWDRTLLEEAARAGLARERPDFHYDSLHIVLVDDRPGTDEDRAELAAVGEEGTVRVAVVRRGEQWVADSVVQ